MKTTLEEAQAILTVAQNWAKAHANTERRDEKYEIVVGRKDFGRPTTVFA